MDRGEDSLGEGMRRSQSGDGEDSPEFKENFEIILKIIKD